MKTPIFRKTRLLLITAALVAVISAPAVSVVRADATLLRGFDVPATAPFDNDVIYWPIGVTFDGTNLWYSEPTNNTANSIFLSTTTGHLLRTLNVINQAGALAWDGTYLWVAEASNNPNSQTCTVGVSGCAFLYKVDVNKNKVIKTVDISAVFAPDQECNFIDGLNWDPSTNSLWVSPDIGCAAVFAPPCSIGFVYNIDTNGNLIKRIQEPFGVAGVARVGSHLYMVTCKTKTTQTGRPIIKTTLDGTPVSNFTTFSVSGNRESAESLSFDSNTFNNACALWVMQDYGIPFDASLAAYKITCPQNDLGS
jgi:hypothetical protein